MILPEDIPTLEQFLLSPLKNIIETVPNSIVYAPGGTRRSALFQNIEPWTREYIQWAQAGTINCLELIFRHGVRHIFLPLFMSRHVQEITDLEKELARPASYFVASDSMLEAYCARGWRVRLTGGDFSPHLREAQARLRAETPASSQKTLWWTASLGIQAQWETIFASIAGKHIQSTADAIRAVYGEDVPPITLFLGFGKPFVSPELFPPLLQGDVQCYWSQQIGYSLTERQLRMILYDYAYLRQTWSEDKTARAAQAQADRALWESEYILGLGRRIGPFWYPTIDGCPTEHVP
jgi:hypothetical protein